MKKMIYFTFVRLVKEKISMTSKELTKFMDSTRGTNISMAATVFPSLFCRM